MKYIGNDIGKTTKTRAITVRSLLDKYDLKCGCDRIHGVIGIGWLKDIYVWNRLSFCNADYIRD